MHDLPCGCLIIDEGRRILDVNPEAERLLRRTRADLVGKNFSHVLSPSSRIFFHAQVFPPLALLGRAEELYITLRCGDEDHPFLLSAARQERPTGLQFSFAFLPIHRRAHFEHELARARDSADRAERVAQRTREELESIQHHLSFSDRLAAVGTLAAGMAHEINNPLTYVLMNLESLRETLDRGDAVTMYQEAGTYLSEAMEGGERIRRIVADLRLLSRQEAPPRHRVRLADVVDSSLRMTGPLVRRKSSVVATIVSPDISVHGDEGHLIQVVVNLVLNAAQAMVEDDPERNRIDVTLYTAPDGHAALDVRDNGAGIPDAIRERIFEPFFTTKPAGTGTGLGLSVCQGIVAAMHGWIEVESAVGVGTTFSIRLPQDADAARETVD